MRYNYDLLNKYGIQNNIDFSSYSAQKITRDTLINLKCSRCAVHFNKTFGELFRLGCFCKKCAAANGLCKAKKTFLDKYGVEYPSQNKKVQDKIKQSFYLKKNMFTTNNKKPK